MNLFFLLAATSLTTSPLHPSALPGEHSAETSILVAQSEPVSTPTPTPAAETVVAETVAVETVVVEATDAALAPSEITETVVVEETINVTEDAAPATDAAMSDGDSQDPASEEPAPDQIENLPDLDSVLSQPLPQGENLNPDSSLLIDQRPLEPFPEEISASDRLSIEAPPQPKFALKDRIRFRKVRTQALTNPEIQAASERAAAATTDLEKREALKQYYTLLFVRMRAIDKTVVDSFKDFEKEALSPLDQYRVTPTVDPDAVQ